MYQFWFLATKNYPLVQWAAEMMWVFVTKTPPQKLIFWFRRSATIHGHSFGSAGRPPTILVLYREFIPQPINGMINFVDIVFIFNYTYLNWTLPLKGVMPTILSSISFSSISFLGLKFGSWIKFAFSSSWSGQQIPGINLQTNIHHFNSAYNFSNVSEIFLFTIIAKYESASMITYEFSILQKVLINWIKFAVSSLTKQLCRYLQWPVRLPGAIQGWKDWSAWK